MTTVLPTPRRSAVALLVLATSPAAVPHDARLRFRTTPGCGSARRPAAGGTRVGVTERDFHIGAPSTVAAGGVAFAVHNEGPERHEFILAHAHAHARAAPAPRVKHLP